VSKPRAGFDSQYRPAAQPPRRSPLQRSRRTGRLSPGPWLSETGEDPASWEEQEKVQGRMIMSTMAITIKQDLTTNHLPYQTRLGPLPGRNAFVHSTDSGSVPRESGNQN
jgi:hypothetical protein